MRVWASPKTSLDIKIMLHSGQADEFESTSLVGKQHGFTEQKHGRATTMVAMGPRYTGNPKVKIICETLTRHPHFSPIIFKPLEII